LQPSFYVEITGGSSGKEWWCD